ncbi:TIGR04283 family arsenosugar biosynthesis glycosyltransferase [Eudoraea adriatica]|uniref:TIGR04283 family arsenosugar biosynthesis glycosyltransferase n=1 Tax=Eudoraea adriatica TaxID=446681 RepID=UPI00036369FB|nr:TIGR04283 family arsenosugar biosynthesis glycosyltransferase [Eudoraea adriatica]
MKLSNNPSLSIIIPVLNEESNIVRLLEYIQENSSNVNIKEILVVDGGSTDETKEAASQYDVLVLHSEKGRARQMNLGAENAKGEVLYFLHADTFPPKNFDKIILNAIKKGTKTGCFRMKFDSDSRFLSFFSWFSRINHKICRGGDQSLFITRELFNKSGGYDEAYKIYEDNEFISRLYKITDFKILPDQVQTSARKYEQIGNFKLQFYFGIIHLKNYLGADPEQLYRYYKRKIST